MLADGDDAKVVLDARNPTRGHWAARRPQRPALDQFTEFNGDAWAAHGSGGAQAHPQ